jgi:type I restriction enzyme, S subunit
MGKLGSLCEFLNGGTPSKDKAHFFEGDIPWITSADITGPIAGTARSLITEEAIQQSATNKVAKGTVLLVTRTGVGKVAIAGNDLCFSQDITAIKPDSAKLETSYLVHFLRTKQTHFERLARGATIKGITRDVVADLEIPLPPLSAQQRIAAILDRADDLRAKRREALAQLDELQQAIFMEMFGQSGCYPEQTLDKLCELITDGTHQTPTYADEGVTFLSAKNVTSGIIDWTDIKFIPEWLHVGLHKRLAPRRNDILLAKNGTTGVAAIVDRDDVFDIYVSLALLRPKQDVLPIYLHAAINSPICKKQFNGALKGIGVPNLHLKEIRSTTVPAAPLKAQQEFGRHISALNAIKVANKASLHELDGLFSSLQHHAFRGEL